MEHTALVGYQAAPGAITAADALMKKPEPLSSGFFMADPCHNGLRGEGVESLVSGQTNGIMR